jgi:hypothetical protein
VLRRITLLIAIALASVAGFGATQASAADFFGQPVSPGTTIPSLQAAGLVTLKDVTVTSAADGNVNARANLYAGASTTPVAITINYRDRANWTVNVVRNSAGGGYSPLSPTSLNLQNVDGTITSTGGRLSYQLILHGYVLGDATFDMTVYVDGTGWVATAVVEDLELGSFTLEHASVEVSTIDAFAEVNASLHTTGGNFDVDIKATKPGNATPNQYTLDILFEGAELEGENPAFQFHSFAFRTTLTNPTTGCATIGGSAQASVTIGTTTYTINDLAIGITCDKLTRFVFSVTVSHYETWSKVTKTGTMTVAFDDPGSNAASPVMSPPGTVNTRYQGSYPYWRGFFGSTEFTAGRTVSKKIDGTRFERGVTIGIGFLVAVYQPVVAKVSGKSYRLAPGDWTAAIGAGGFVDADRVSGGISCALVSADFRCIAKMTLNPSWGTKDKYSMTWDDL